jgi:hypothetical protein
MEQNMNTDSRFYTTLQYQEFVDENDNCYRNMDDSKVFAKSLKTGYSKNIRESGPKYDKFFVRVYPNKKLYDPFPRYSMSDNKNSFVDKICKSENAYKQVTEIVFNNYLNYLRTENIQWYNKAQREISNL